MRHIDTPKIHAKFAKAQEKLGNYKDAAASYSVANMSDDLVRVHLQHLDNQVCVYVLICLSIRTYIHTYIVT